MPDLNFPRISGIPTVSAKYNALPEHFQVNEIPDFDLAGEGDHYYLQIRKTNLNTHTVVQKLSNQFGLKPVDVGYAGRKDKWAITTQWFSVHAPTLSLADIQAVNDPDFDILQIKKHTKKLRTGQLTGNHFIIQLTEVNGDVGDVLSRLKTLKDTGWPNYFGHQRFGSAGQNIIRGERMLSGELRVKDRNQRSLYLSACRSYLFNCVLAERISRKNWNKEISGDVLDTDSNILGPMMGDGDSPATDDARTIELSVINKYEKLFTGIQNARIAWQGRPFVLHPTGLAHTQNDMGIQLEFSLPKGAYATVILQELVQF